MLGSTTLYTVVAALALSSQAKYHGLSRRAPSGWAYGYLEDYHTYHIRYLALGCQFKHGAPGQHGQTQFFEDCCHPMLGTETLEKNRPAHCVPGAQALHSASIIEPTANPTSIAPPASATIKIAAVQPTSSAAAPAVTSAVTDEEDCEDDENVEDNEELCEEDQDDDDEEDCEDDEEASAAPAPAPSPSVKAPVKAAPAPTPSPIPSPAPAPSSVAAPQASSAAAPAPVASSSKAAPAPAPSPEVEPVKPSSAKAPTPEPTPAPSNGNEEVTGGKATFYFQNGNAGACGEKRRDDELIVAMDQGRYGALNKQSDLCGKYVVITNPKNGKSVTAQVADVCPTCTNSNSIDMSHGAFTKIATEDEGMVDITWHFA